MFMLCTQHFMTCSKQADVEVTFELPNLEEAEVFDASWDDPQSLCSIQDASFQGKLGPFGLLALASGDLKEQTAIFFRIFKGENKHVVLMCSDQSRLIKYSKSHFWS